MRLNLSPRALLLAFGALLLGGYILFEARFIIVGPHISVQEPLDGTRVSAAVVLLKGKADNITHISVDDRPIFIDEHGNFEEKVIVSPGLDTITIWARDRFGRETDKSLRIVYNK